MDSGKGQILNTDAMNFKVPSGVPERIMYEQDKYELLNEVENRLNLIDENPGLVTLPSLIRNVTRVSKARRRYWN